MTARHSLDQIVRGLDGVTEGPWFEGDHWVFVEPATGEPTHPLENIFDHDKPQANAAHVAPDDVAAIRKADRVRAKFIGAWPKSRTPLKSRGFQKRTDP